MKVENLEEFKKSLVKEDGVIHSPIGASSMHRWSVCPGSVRLSSNVPSVSSSYADEGTEAHAWLAKVIAGLVPLSSVPEDE